MLELLKRSMLAGIGAAVVTADKIREATRKFVDEGKISTEEAERFADDLVKSGQKELEEINAKFHSSLKKVSGSLDLVRKKELADLEARVALLEERLSRLEKKD
jgi:polyhydroxyalkanoate synthesis regulator phasin